LSCIAAAAAVLKSTWQLYPDEDGRVMEAELWSLVFCDFSYAKSNMAKGLEGQFGGEGCSSVPHKHTHPFNGPFSGTAR